MVSRERSSHAGHGIFCYVFCIQGSWITGASQVREALALPSGTGREVILSGRVRRCKPWAAGVGAHAGFAFENDYDDS